MTKDEFIASCRLLGRPVFYFINQEVYEVHLRKGWGMIRAKDERMGEPVSTYETPHWGLKDGIPYPYEVLLERLINYLESTHD